MAMPTHCHQCRDNQLTTKGLGTEQIEMELATQFPKLRIERLDTDTTRGKNSLETILDRFKNREIDVLIGTQMVAKGLDFKMVTLVGIIHADALWYQPDFRASERCYQLLTQVSGRAGRAELAGQVLIQTYQPSHPIIELVQQGNYLAMFKSQQTERQSFNYPPFCRLIRITLRHKNYELVQQAANWLANSIRQSIETPLLGPEEPPIARIRNEFHRTMMMKIPLHQSTTRVKKQLQRTLTAFESIAAYKSVKRTITVDPY
jgi:primosomal protein N' (replication factor Y)